MIEDEQFSEFRSHICYFSCFATWQNDTVDHPFLISEK